LTYKANDGKTTATFGKDDVWMGAGLLMDANFEAIQFATEAGGVKVSAFAGRDGEMVDPDVDPIVTAIHDLAGASLQTKVGNTDLGVSFFQIESENALSVNVGTQFGKLGLAAEFADFSDADAQNLMVSGTYGNLEKKGDTKFTVMYFDTEYTANLWTTLDVADTVKGVSVQVDNMMADNVKLTLEQQMGDTVDRSRVYVTAKF
jgi:hypothetical protein